MKQIGNWQSAMASPVRIGVVGLGWWACDVHIPNLLRVPGARLTALCSRSAAGRERGLAAAKGQAAPRLFERAEDLLASDAVDAVVVCTPNATHAALTLQALRAGKHVLVEKPLALEPADCPPIVAEARARGLVVQVGVELRYSDVATAVRRLMDEGRVGRPVVLRTSLWRHWGAPHGWRADERHGRETLHELAVHYLDLLNALAGCRPLWVAAAGGGGVTGHQPDHVLLTVGYDGGAVGSFGMCLFAAGSGGEIPVEVVGSEGRLAGEIAQGTLHFWPREGEGQDVSPRRTTGQVFGFPGSYESVVDFVRCIQEGRDALADAAEGEVLCRMCHAARVSMGRGGSPGRI
jgi:predicted dehydrogenase